MFANPRVLPIVCCALFLACQGAAARASETVTLTIGEWLPYASEKAPHQGPVARIVSEAFALEGVDVRLIFRPWNRAYQEAASGSVNGSAIWSTGAGDSDRNRRFYFTDAIVEGQSVFFHLKTQPFTWNSYAQLRGLAIGGTTGYEYAFDKDPLITIDRSAASDELNFHKLLAGRFQIFPDNLDIGLSVMRRALTPEQADLITWDPKPYNRPRYYVMLNKDIPANRRYLALFNRGLRRLKDSGRYQQYIDEMRSDEMRSDAMRSDAVRSGSMRGNAVRSGSGNGVPGGAH